jgi:sugar phosphate permease
MKTRHVVLSILFITWVVSYMDRTVMSVAMPYIAADYHLSPVTSGIVISIFFAGYSIAHIPGGLLADKFGVRRVATVAMLWWSVFTTITGGMANAAQMLVARFAFGLGEGVFPPCAFKTIAVWFPKKERATANAIMLASNPFGLAISPLVAVAIMSFWGWRAAFYCLCIPGILVSLLFWIFVPNSPSQSSRISPEELAEIEGSEDSANQVSEARVPLLQILMNSSVLKYFFVLFTFDIANWGFTTFLPTYLVKVRGFSMVQMGVAASLPFFAGTVGYILGGWLSDRYFSNNRRIPIIGAHLISALLLYLTFTASSAAVLVICQTMAGFFLSSFFATFWAFPMNTVPKKLMGVASGFINMAGQIAAFLAPICMGYLVSTAKGNFESAFGLLIASLLVSCGIVFMLPRKLKPVSG